MKPWAYYNEFDAKKAAWLRELMRASLIAPGEVDERSIADVRASELVGFTQCHFFAGIGVWSYALRLAGWDDSRPVWTGSCPCQPFSAAGKRAGTEDERHLWPEWFRLISECRPPVIFGEQVASAQVIGYAGKGPRIPIETSAQPQGEGLDSPREIARGKEGIAVRSGQVRTRNSSTDRCGGVRDYRASAQLGFWPDMGQSLIGSAEAQGRVHVSEPADSLPCNEQRDGGLGREQSNRDGECGPREKAESVKRFIRGFIREAESKNGKPWLDVVSIEMEKAGYAIGAVDLPAAGFGAPHIRQRLFFVAQSDSKRHKRNGRARNGRPRSAHDSGAGLMGHSNEAGSQGRSVGRDGAGERAAGAASVAGIVAHAACDGRKQRRAEPGGRMPESRCCAGELVNPEGIGWAGRTNDENGGRRELPSGSAIKTGQLGDSDRERFDGEPVSVLIRGSRQDRAKASRPGPANGFWAGAEWIYCRDERWRPTEPGTFPLASGAPARVGRLRGYGDAIVAQAAAGFIGAYMEIST